MVEEWNKIQTVKRFLNDLEENLKRFDKLNEVKLELLNGAKEKIRESELPSFNKN